MRIAAAQQEIMNTQTIGASKRHKLTLSFAGRKSPKSYAGKPESFALSRDEWQRIVADMIG